MTLCIVWRDDQNVHFASDSRLSFGEQQCDAAIKICRFPYSIYDATCQTTNTTELLASGDLGLTFAGSSNVALMTKEALSEVVRDLQGVPGTHPIDMDGIFDVMYRGFQVVCKQIGSVIFNKAAAVVVFSGYCETNECIRVFLMKYDECGNFSGDEILKNTQGYEVFGSGKSHAVKILSNNPTPSGSDLIETLESVIDDSNVSDVGGPIQYGCFDGKKFQPSGVSKICSQTSAVQYLRGPFDLNGPDFDQSKGLIPRLPFLDLRQIR